MCESILHVCTELGIYSKFRFVDKKEKTWTQDGGNRLSCSRYLWADIREESAKKKKHTKKIMKKNSPKFTETNRECLYRRTVQWYLLSIGNIGKEKIRTEPKEYPGQSKLHQAYKWDHRWGHKQMVSYHQPRTEHVKIYSEYIKNITSFLFVFLLLLIVSYFRFRFVAKSKMREKEYGWFINGATKNSQTKQQQPSSFSLQPMIWTSNTLV